LKESTNHSHPISEASRRCSGTNVVVVSSRRSSDRKRVDRKNPPPPGGFPIYFVPSSRTVIKRTPLEGFVPGSSRGVLLLTVLDEGT